MEEEDYLKALVSGVSGAGKSAMAATMPAPLAVLLSEEQGRLVIKKRAKELGRPAPAIMRVSTLQHYRDFVKAMRAWKEGPFEVTDKDSNVLLQMETRPRSVAIDSITDACDLVYQEVVEDAPLKLSDDGLPVFTQRHWTELEARCKRLFRAFRDLPSHVLFLAILEEKVTETSDGKSTRMIGPQLPQRRLPAALMQCTNVAGILMRSSQRPGKDAPPGTDRILTWEVQTLGPSDMLVKPMRPLPDYAPPDFMLWVDACIHGHEVPSTRAGAEPEPTAQESGRRRNRSEVV